MEKGKKAKRRGDAIATCGVSGRHILCVRCGSHRSVKQRKGKPKVCDMHRAVENYVEDSEISDENPFRIAEFARRVDWTKIEDTCNFWETHLAAELLGHTQIRPKLGAAIV